jgi:large subunit ribosomal protein L32
MAVPKQRHTKSRRNKRRMHIHMDVPDFVVCKKCGKRARAHTVCVYCGYYKGKEVVNVLEKLGKKEKKQRTKDIAEHEKEEKKTKPLTMQGLSKK